MSLISDIQNKAKDDYQKKQRSKKRKSKSKNSISKEAYIIAAVIADQEVRNYNNIYPKSVLS